VWGDGLRGGVVTERSPKNDEKYKVGGDGVNPKKEIPFHGALDYLISHCGADVTFGELYTEM
jgi:hypothetical protein